MIMMIVIIGITTTPVKYDRGVYNWLFAELDSSNLTKSKMAPYSLVQPDTSALASRMASLLKLHLTPSLATLS